MGQAWGRNWSAFIKRIQKSVLVMTEDVLVVRSIYASRTQPLYCDSQYGW